MSSFCLHWKPACRAGTTQLLLCGVCSVCRASLNTWISYRHYPSKILYLVSNKTIIYNFEKQKFWNFCTFSVLFLQLLYFFCTKANFCTFSVLLEKKPVLMLMRGNPAYMRGCTDMNDCGSIKIPMNEYVEVAKFKEKRM